MSKKKERKHNINIDLPFTMNGGKIFMDNKTGEIHIFDVDGRKVSPEGLILEHYYEGDKKRTLSRLVAGKKHALNGLSDPDFLATYDLIYIVDTNRLETSDKKTHDITAFIRAKITCIPGAHKVEMYERVGYFHFINLTEIIHPEKVGWITLIQQNFFQEDLRSGLSTAIITDHDISNLQAYNSREKAVFDVHYIPEDVTLMFAKADKSDTLVNKLIKATDGLSNRYKERFLRGEITFPLQDYNLFECDGFSFLNESGLTLHPNVIKRHELVFNNKSKISCQFFDENGIEK